MTTPTLSETVSAESSIRSAVDAYLARAVGWTADSCTCSVALAVSFDGDADAVASPLLSGFAPGIAGHSGDAVSVSFSGNGTADAEASSGGAGNAGVATVGAEQLPTAEHGQLDAGTTADSIADGIRGLVADLITAAGQTGSGGDPLGDVRASPAASPPRVAVDLTSTGPLGECAQVSGCAVAIGISVNGAATATLGSTRQCGGPVGGATAVAIAVGHDAHASAATGNDGQCAHAAPTRTVVSAIAGNTGAAYGVSLASDGPSRSSAQSGHLGTTSTQADADTTTPEAASLSGSTGDSAGVAIGADSADAVVRSGNSGDASARCQRCAMASGGSSMARSGDTGSSYAVAGAGMAARVSATSGDSGDADARAFGWKDAGSGNGATVTGHSGDTGNAFAVAIDLRTWVTVLARSGFAGQVITVAKGPESRSNVSTVKPSGRSSTHVGRGPATRPKGRPGGLLSTAEGAAHPARAGSAPAGHAAPPSVAGPNSPLSPARRHPDSALVGEPAATAANFDAQSIGSSRDLDRVSRFGSGAGGAMNGTNASARTTALGIGLIGIPPVLLSGAALVAAAIVRRRRRSRP